MDDTHLSPLPAAIMNSVAKKQSNPVYDFELIFPVYVLTAFIISAKFPSLFNDCDSIPRFKPYLFPRKHRYFENYAFSNK